MAERLMQNLHFIILTFLLMALIFVILLAVGWKRNKAYLAGHRDELLRGPQARDIVLLRDGRRVTLVEAMVEGERFLAETVADYGKKPEKVTVQKSEITRIEYYG